MKKTRMHTLQSLETTVRKVIGTAYEAGWKAGYQKAYYKGTVHRATRGSKTVR